MSSTTQQTDNREKSAQIKQWFPGLKVLRNYQYPWLRRDLMSGLVLCTPLVLQGMAYAVLSHH